MSRPDRRCQIADAALGLAASGGTHALTHQAIDRRLDLPKGSTSYYFRTREALLLAAADRLITLSRERFHVVLGQPGASSDPVEVISEYVTGLVTDRVAEVIARQALLLDLGIGDDVRGRLRRCMFSEDAAAGLMESLGSAQPHVAARRLVTVLEGVVYSHTQGLERDEPHSSRRGVIADLVTRTLLTLR
ncbi:TetR family transcriptional regulator [Gordonia oryzae]|uniref:TetR family transcriptional regulator n=1 Tax=Gordonia oryzae TaxID=2487349 RepID=A0A3N4GDD1_9ACTN|nr:TetR family transcriptional regulator [Gordonia oryzae]RPA57001.1 TetR family transcriptional regulator [Gordonia oryzae]